jgi:hypothetical protein
MLNWRCGFAVELDEDVCVSVRFGWGYGQESKKIMEYAGNDQ